MSIRKRGDRWLVTVELGRDQTGRRRRHCSTHATEDAAKKAEAVARAKVATDSWVDESRVTVDAYLARWLESRERDLTWATHDTYRRRIEGPIHDRLGALQLRRVRPASIVALESHLFASGLSATTVRKYRTMLHGAFGAAVAWGLITKNPVHGLAPIHEDTPEVRWLSATEQAVLLDAARSGYKGRTSRLYLPVLLGLATGARRLDGPHNPRPLLARHPPPSDRGGGAHRRAAPRHARGGARGVLAS